MARYISAIYAVMIAVAAFVVTPSTAQADCFECVPDTVTYYPVTPSYRVRTINKYSTYTRYRDIYRTNFVYRTRSIYHITRIRPIVRLHTVNRIHHRNVALIRNVNVYRVHRLPTRYVHSSSTVHLYNGCVECY